MTAYPHLNCTLISWDYFGWFPRYKEPKEEGEVWENRHLGAKEWTRIWREKTTSMAYGLERKVLIKE